MRPVLIAVVLAGCAPAIVVGQDELTSVTRECGNTPGYHRTQSTLQPNHCLRWQLRTLTWHLDNASITQLAPQAAHDAITRAFSHWQQAGAGCSDLAFEEGAAVNGSSVGNDGANEIIFRSQQCSDVVPGGDACWHDASCGDVYSCWDHNFSTVAITTVSYASATGVVLDADIELNEKHFLFTTVDSPACPASAPASTCVSTDLEGTMTHEVGHLLGLDHTKDGSVMTPTVSPGELSLRTIDASSACFICDAYPTGNAARDCE